VFEGGIVDGEVRKGRVLADGGGTKVLNEGEKKKEIIEGVKKVRVVTGKQGCVGDVEGVKIDIVGKAKGGAFRGIG